MEIKICNLYSDSKKIGEVPLGFIINQKGERVKVGVHGVINHWFIDGGWKHKYIFNKGRPHGACINFIR